MSYKIISPINEHKILTVEFTLSDGGKHTTTLQMDEDETRPLEKYLEDYQISYEKGLIIQHAEELESAKFDQIDLEKQLEVLKSIWGTYDLRKKPGHVLNFLNIMQHQDGFPKTLTLWQKRNVYMLTESLKDLDGVNGFTHLKSQLGSDGSYDDQLLASIFYHIKFGLSCIEFKVGIFDVDFSYLDSGVEVLVQVKNLTPNSSKKIIEHFQIAREVQTMLKQLGKGEVGVDLTGDPPREVLDNYDWFACLKDIRLPRTVHIKDSTSTGPGLTINLRPNSVKGRVGEGLDSIFAWNKRVKEVAGRIGEKKSDTVYACLLVVPEGTIGQLEKFQSEIFSQWRDSDLDALIFFEYSSGTMGYKFQAMEQRRDGSGYKINKYQKEVL